MEGNHLSTKVENNHSSFTFSAGFAHPHLLLLDTLYNDGFHPAMLLCWATFSFPNAAKKAPLLAGE